MSKVGTVLVAHPNLPANDSFYKSVVYIYADNEQGSMGLILNKPTRYSVAELANSYGIEFPYSRDYVRFGGPLNDKALIMIHTSDWRSTNTTHISKGVCLSSDDFMLEKLSIGYRPVYWRLTSGVCGWAPAQLDMELTGKFPYDKKNSWLTCDANDDIMFGYDGEEQWEHAVKLCGKQMIDSYF
jgi:putative transcriptional regulator